MDNNIARDELYKSKIGSNKLNSILNKVYENEENINSGETIINILKEELEGLRDLAISENDAKEFISFLEDRFLATQNVAAELYKQITLRKLGNYITFEGYNPVDILYDFYTKNTNNPRRIEDLKRKLGLDDEPLLKTDYIIECLQGKAKEEFRHLGDFRHMAVLTQNPEQSNKCEKVNAIMIIEKTDINNIMNVLSKAHEIDYDMLTYQEKQKIITEEIPELEEIMAQHYPLNDRYFMNDIMGYLMNKALLERGNEAIKNITSDKALSILSESYNEVRNSYDINYLENAIPGLNQLNGQRIKSIIGILEDKASQANFANLVIGSNLMATLSRIKLKKEIKNGKNFHKCIDTLHDLYMGDMDTDEKIDLLCRNFENAKGVFENRYREQNAMNEHKKLAILANLEKELTKSINKQSLENSIIAYAVVQEDEIARRDLKELDEIRTFKDIRREIHNRRDFYADVLHDFYMENNDIDTTINTLSEQLNVPGNFFANENEKLNIINSIADAITPDQSFIFDPNFQDINNTNAKIDDIKYKRFENKIQNKIEKASAKDMTNFANILSKTHNNENITNDEKISLLTRELPGAAYFFCFRPDEEKERIANSIIDFLDRNVIARYRNFNIRDEQRQEKETNDILRGIANEQLRQR